MAAAQGIYTLAEKNNRIASCIKNSIKMMRMMAKIFKAQAVIFFTTSYQ